MPQRSVKLHYQDRPDKTISYIGGSMVQITKRLDTLSTYVEDKLVKQYRLSYGTSTTSARSILQNLTECDNNEYCYSPTVFAWNNEIASTHQFDQQSWNEQGDWLSEGKTASGDYNGDGLGDIAYIFNQSGQITMDVYTSTENAFSRKKWSAPHGAWQQGIFTGGDFNGDGLSDVVSIFNQTGKVGMDIYLSTKHEFDQQSGFTSQTLWHSDAQFNPGDFNGDGLTDVAIIFNDAGKIGLDIYLSTGTTFEKMPWDFRQDGNWHHRGIFNPGDFNGDGLTDIGYVFNHKGQVEIDVYLSTGRAFEKQKWSSEQLAWQEDNLVSFSDFNGDAITDMAWFFNDSGKIGAQVFISNGKAFHESDWSGKDDTRPVWRGKSVIKPGDYNGDGLTDVGYIFKDDDQKTSVAIYLSTGKEFQTSEWATSQGSWSNQDFYPRDYSGNGKTDIANIFNNSGKLAIHVHKVVPNHKNSPQSILQSDLLTIITNGLGGKISLEYKPITDSTVYEKGKGGIFPTIEVNVPWYVVSRQTTTELLRGNISVSQHRYKHARIDLQGRGWLGFAETSITDLSDPDLQTTSVSYYHQTFPLTGMLYKQELIQGSDKTLLNRSVNKYDKVISPNKIYTAYKVSESNEHYTNGHYGYTVSKKYVYDPEYKNIIRIDDLADTSDANADTGDDVYICFQYNIDPEASWWKQFFPTAKKITRTKNACSEPDFQQWNVADDLRFYHFGYDQSMNMNSQKIWHDQKNKWIEQQEIFDDYGNMISMTDPMGNTTHVHYDERYHTFPQQLVMPSANPDEKPLTFNATYEPHFGVAMQFIDLNGNIALQVPTDGLDSFGRITRLSGIQPDDKELKPLMAMTFSKNNAVGMEIKTTLRELWQQDDINQWYWQTDTFDGFNRKVRNASKGPNDKTHIMAEVNFNNKGLIKQKTLPYFSDQKPQAIEYLYNIRNKLTQTQLPDGAINKINYDKLNDRIVITESPNPADIDQQSTWVKSSSVWNSRGRLIQQTHVNGGLTYYKYDPLGQNISIHDPLGNVSQVNYNSLGQIMTSEKPELGKSAYTYDDNGLLQTSVDAEQQKRAFTYDALGRVTSIKNYTADKALEKTITYTYDTAENGKGLLASTTTPDMEYRFAYNYLAKVKQQSITLDSGNEKTTHITTYNYDALQRPQEITHPDETKVRYSYHPQGELHTVALQKSNAKDFLTLATYSDYTPLGQYQTSLFNNGTQSSFTYDVLGRKKTSTTKNSAQILRHFEYNWNHASKLLDIGDLRENPEVSLTQAFTYDEMGYLSTAFTLRGKQSYQYNLSGGITQFNDTRYVYDTAKKHQIINTCQISPQNNCDEQADMNLTVSYDNNGNTVQKNSYATGNDGSTDWHYRYDVQNNLVQVQQQKLEGKMATIDTFTYDDSWRRIKKTVADGDTTLYITPAHIMTRKQSGQTSTTQYIHGAQGIIASLTEEKGIRYLHPDHLGSTTLQTDGSGTETNRIVYSAYGRVDQKNSFGADDVRFKFTGKELDSESELYYYGARYYDPQLKVFTTPDPKQQFDNSYVYVGSDPVTRIDPDGQAFIEIAITSTAVATTTGTAAAATTTGAVAFAGSGMSVGGAAAVNALTGLAAPASAAVGGGVSAGLVGIAVGVTSVATAATVSTGESLSGANEIAGLSANTALSSIISASEQIEFDPRAYYLSNEKLIRQAMSNDHQLSRAWAIANGAGTGLLGGMLEPIEEEDDDDDEKSMLAASQVIQPQVIYPQVIFPQISHSQIAPASALNTSNQAIPVQVVITGSSSVIVQNTFPSGGYMNLSVFFIGASYSAYNHIVANTLEAANGDTQMIIHHRNLGNIGGSVALGALGLQLRRFWPREWGGL